MTTPDFTTTFLVNMSPEKTFKAITNVPAWWSGLYGEEIEGAFSAIGDEFTFRAAGGKHYSRQRLVELLPNQKVVWLVIESNLSFLHHAEEWTGSRICFELEDQGEKTKVRFTHQGLVPGVECYDACSSTWPKYLHHLHALQRSDVNKAAV